MRNPIALLTLIAISTYGAACSRTTAAKVDSPAPADQRFAGLGTPEHRVIVRLVGRNQVLTVSSGPNGPVYSVADAQGRTTLAHATLDELRVKHPELYQQIRGTVASDTAPAVEAHAEGTPAQAPILIMSRHE